MKRTIVYLIVTLSVVGSVCADQTVRSVQQTLKDQGFYYGKVTGNKSSETVAAVRRYQIRNGLQVTGEMNPETLRALNIEPNSIAPLQSTSKPAVAQQNTNTARPVETPQVDQNSVQQSPSTPETNSALLAALYQSVSPRTKKRLVIAEVQRQLISRGYYQGRIDGNYGRRTAFAVRAFQFGSGLPPSGRLDTPTLNSLGMSNETLASLQPAPHQDESWMPVVKFKHGRWKVKWEKSHRDDHDELAGDDHLEDGSAHSRGPD